MLGKMIIEENKRAFGFFGCILDADCIKDEVDDGISEDGDD